MKYWMDETFGVTVCKMNTDSDFSDKSPRDHAIDYLVGRMCKSYRNFYNKTMSSWYDRSTIQDLIEPAVNRHVKMEYCGRSRCMAPDVWDEEKGKEIARAKCLRKFYADVYAAAEEVNNLLASLRMANSTMQGKASRSFFYWSDKAAPDT